MSKSKMLMSSLILTVCLVTISIVVLLFTGENSPLSDKLAENTTITEEPIQAVLASEEVPEEEFPSVMEGHRSETDHLGMHDILFESGEVEWQATSGPVVLTVVETRLEKLTAQDESIIKAVEGRVPATVVVLNVQIENTSDQPVLFKFDEAKVQIDTGEKTVINPKISTVFGSEIAPNTRKKGVVMIDIASKARDLTSVTLKVFPTYNLNYDEIGETVLLKIPMY